MDIEREPGFDVEVAIIGGGPAGLAAALVLARSRRSVLVVDAGSPRNARAPGVHSFLTREGTPPGEILALGRADVARYGGSVIEGRVIGGEVDADERVKLSLADGAVVTARRVIVTSGIVDQLPDVAGLADHWGTDVVHCPFCHGWEVAGRRIGVLATSPAATHQATLFAHLAGSLVLLRQPGSGLDDDAVARLAADGVEVVDGDVVAVTSVDGRLVGVELADARTVSLGALVVAPRFTIQDGLLHDLGLEIADHPSGLGQHVAAGPAGETSVPQVWVAGNVTDPTAQVVTAISQGNTTGARVHYDLLATAQADGAG